jgi:hypothetical protein
VEKYLINKLLIPKDSSSIKDKYDDYNNIPNSSILQDSCIIIIIILFFLMLYSNFVMKTLENFGVATNFVLDLA